jgi:hypothetical protein
MFLVPGNKIFNRQKYLSRLPSVKCKIMLTKKIFVLILLQNVATRRNKQK